MNFRVGMKVVCVDDTFKSRGSVYIDLHGRRRVSSGETGGLKKNAVYTVAEVRSSVFETLILSEINRGPLEQGFRSSRFRPAVSPKSEISFTQGAPLDSEQWDNRRRLPARVGASA